MGRRSIRKGNKEILSKEGTTQGDPTAVGAYALGVTLLLQISKEKLFVDDFTVTGKVDEIKSYWYILQQVSPLYGYFPKPSKPYLIVTEYFYVNAKETLENSDVKLITEATLGQSSEVPLKKKPSWKVSLKTGPNN